MLLQLKQIPVSRYDEVRLPGLGALQNTVVRVVTQHTNNTSRPNDLGDAANLPYISDDVCLGGVELLPKRSGEFCQEGGRHDEGAPPFQSRTIRFLGKSSKKRRDKDVGVEDYPEHELPPVQNPIHVLFGANDKARLPRSPLRGPPDSEEFFSLSRHKVRFPHSSQQLALGLLLLPGSPLNLSRDFRRNRKRQDLGRPSHGHRLPSLSYT